MPVPRLTAWYGDSGKSYTYSGPDYESHMRSDGLPEAPGVDPDPPPGAASGAVTRALPDVVDLTPAP